MSRKTREQERHARAVAARLRNDGGDRPVVFCTCVTGRGRRYCKIHTEGNKHG